MLKKILSLSAVCILFSLQASANIRNYIPSYQMAEGPGLLDRTLKSIKKLLPFSSDKQKPTQDIPSSHQVINPENSTEEAQKDTTNTATSDTQHEVAAPALSPSQTLPTLVNQPTITPALTTPVDESTSHPAAIEALPSIHPEQTDILPAPQPAESSSEDASTRPISSPAEPTLIPVNVLPLTPVHDSIPANQTPKPSKEITAPTAETSQEVK